MRLIHFDAEQNMIREYRLPLVKFLAIPFSFFLIIAVISASATISLKLFRQNTLLQNLQQENSYLRTSLGRLNERARRIDAQLNTLKQKSDLLRTFAALPSFDEDTWSAGMGGSEHPDMHPLATSDVIDEVLRDDSHFDALQQRISFLYADLLETEKKLSADSELRQHTPSILPVKNGRITSSFGRRIDPFTQEEKMHNGIDIIAREGSEVLAPADGVVVLVRRKYSPNEALGKVVVIRHGKTLLTRYGHLKKILVKQGQKVKRHEVIALVGNTGRSTGPHLHYEVIRNKRFQNPEWYVLNSD